MFPMPISPTPTASMPSALACRARSSPTARASIACCSVMAGSTAISPVENRTFRSSTWGQGTGVRMPTSTTCTSSPKYAANADIPVLCRVMFTACCTVTGGAGYALRHHAVVRRQHRHPAPPDLRPGRPQDPRQPDGHILQRPQTARGLGQLRLPPPGGVHGLPVCRENGLHICCQFLPCHVFAPYPCSRSHTRDGPQS